MNLAELARGLQTELNRVHDVNNVNELKNLHAHAKRAADEAATKCCEYFNAVLRYRDEHTPKCPTCHHAWGLHTELGEYQDYLGCGFGWPHERCGCIESPQK